MWCWRRLLKVPWTARRSNQSILRKINPEYFLEELMLKLKLQYFGHLMRTADSLEKSLMLGKSEGRRRREHQRMRWLDGITDPIDMNRGKLRKMVRDRGQHAAVHGVAKSQTQLVNNNSITEWINNKVLMYSTQNYIQYPMVNHTGKQFFLKMYICVTESLCYIPETNRTLYINYTSILKRKKKILIGRQLLYNMLLVSDIHQHESAISIHTFSPSWTSHPSSCHRAPVSSLRHPGHPFYVW